MKVQELIDYVNSNGFYSVYEFEDSLTDKQFKELKKQYLRVQMQIDIDGMKSPQLYIKLRMDMQE